MTNPYLSRPLPAGPLAGEDPCDGPPTRRWPWPPGAVVLGFTKKGKPIYIPPELRPLGTHIVGLPGQGKSRLGENMLRQDFLSSASPGALLLDPHGTLCASFVNWYTSHGLQAVRPIRVLSAGDPHRIFHLNPLRRRPGVDPAVIAGAVTNAILRVWGGADPTTTPQLRETLKAAMCTLVELGLPITEAGNLLDLTDESGLRAYAAQHVSNPVVRQYLRSLDSLRLTEIDLKVGSALRRLNEFLMPERVRLMFSEPEQAIDWRNVMDAGEFVLFDLSYDHGRLSEDEAQVVGTMILAEIFLSCLGRPENSRPFYVYVDECHRFLTEDVAKLFVEGRKFQTSAVLLHQTLAQLRRAGDLIFSEVMAARTKIVFGGLDDDDATFMARNIFRGQFDLQKSKDRYNKPVVVDQVPEWLLSESDSRSVAVAEGTNWSRGGAVSVSRSTTTSSSVTTTEGSSESATTPTGTDADPNAGSQTTGDSESTAITEGFAETETISESASWSEGGSTTRTESEQHTDGRHQTFRSIFKILPTVPWSLDELLHLASVRLGHLKPGQAVVKIGIRPPSQIKTVRVKDGWARPEHVARATDRLSARTPYVVPAEEAIANHQRRRRELVIRIMGVSAEAGAGGEAEPLPTPKLKDEGWG